jgi:hypothetical protein
MCGRARGDIVCYKISLIPCRLPPHAGLSRGARRTRSAAPAQENLNHHSKVIEHA